MTWTKLEAYETSMINDELDLSNLPAPPPPLEPADIALQTHKPVDVTNNTDNKKKYRRQRSMALGQIDYDNIPSSQLDSLTFESISEGGHLKTELGLNHSRSEEVLTKKTIAINTPKKPSNPPPKVPAKRPSNPPPPVPTPKSPKLSSAPKSLPPTPKKTPLQAPKVPAKVPIQGRISLSHSQPNMPIRQHKDSNSKKVMNRLPNSIINDLESGVSKNISRPSYSQPLEQIPLDARPSVPPPRPSKGPPPRPSNGPPRVPSNGQHPLKQPYPSSPKTVDMTKSNSGYITTTINPTPQLPKLQSTISSPSLNSNLSVKSSSGYVDSQLSPRPTMPTSLKEQLNHFQLEGFAQQYFRSVKKGVFRRNVPVRERITWSKELLKEPLLKINKKFEKKAVEVHKSIQIYMGDRNNGISKDENLKHVQEFIAAGLKHAEMRDELYCQICKQLTLNPNEQSVHKGWELMTISVQYFPPTKDLEPWLVNFMKEHEKSKDTTITKSVEFSIRKLNNISRQGAVLRVPDPSEIEHCLTAALKPHIFGAKLDDICKTHGTDNNIPLVLKSLVERLKELKAHSTEGIFRIPGSTVDCTKMRLQIESGDYNLSSYVDPHVSASVLKFWFRSLEEPVIPSEY